MTTRTFLGDADLDTLMTALADEPMPVATLDQMDAAGREAAHIGQALAAHAVAAGGNAFLGTPGQDTTRLRRMVRPRLRMLLAAFSGGTARLCPHTDQIRPQLLVCDPPALNCMAPVCMTEAAAARERIGVCWDHQCDACGHHAQTLTPVLLGLGPLSISGHLCTPCLRDASTAALDASEDVRPIGRKTACPCGSGRRFKRCHGSPRATA